MVRELEQRIRLVALLVKCLNSSPIRLPVELEEDRHLEWEWDHSRVEVDSVFLPNNNKWAELLDRWVAPEEVALEWEHRQLSSLVAEDFNSSHSSREVLVVLVDLNNSNKWPLLLNKCSGEVNSQPGWG